MSPFMQWVSMHGYAVYVWPAYGLVGLVLVSNAVRSVWQKTRTHHVIRLWLSRQ